MLISVHLPKTAGTSFEESLRSHFGERLRLDYADKPLHRTALQRNGMALSAALRRSRSGCDDDRIACIHGHFLPLAYRWLRVPGGLRFVTWMRDPVQRLASHYHFWRRENAPPAADTLHRRMLEEDWSFERFALGPELRNVYARFLWGFPLRRFDFIGISEHYGEDLQAFGALMLNAPLPLVEARRNPHLDQPGYAIDAALQRRIDGWHSADRRLYERALALRELRLAGS